MAVAVAGVLFGLLRVDSAQPIPAFERKYDGQCPPAEPDRTSSAVPHDAVADPQRLLVDDDPLWNSRNQPFAGTDWAFSEERMAT
jgi:hypothetical protein